MDRNRPIFSSKLAKLEFPKYSGTTEINMVSLASFHLKGKTNQWWLWEELWARFEPTECEDFDEALSRVRQMGFLRDYPKEFERLGNRVHGWMQKALVGTFMGGLKLEITEGIRIFKPRSLKEAISLACIREDQLLHKSTIVFPLRKALNQSMYGPIAHFHLLFYWLKRKMVHGIFALIIELLMLLQLKTDFPFPRSMMC
ncbi:hypothetical protein ACOSP7_018786 [Xanthoceras sorbifolium]